IEDVKHTYSLNPNNINENQKKKFNINDQLFLETLLMMIRGMTIKYSSEKKKRSTEAELKLEKDIESLENQINANFNNVDEQKIQDLSAKKEQLTNLRKSKIDGVMLRSKCRYQDLGEKPTNYFFNLESRNFTSKVINKLVEDGVEFTDTKDILNCQKQFYCNLYKENEILNDIDIENIIGENENKLSDHDSEKLEGEINHRELGETLKNMKNGKSPGQDGFTVEFFKFFWIDIGYFVLRSLNYGYRAGNLSVTQKQGIITCIPKPNKCRQTLKNWRPISLLNVVYKLASAVIASRIKTVLNKLIHEDQKGFLSGRYIGENIRIIYDILFETKKQNLPGLILSIDFEKAFDTVSWKFIDKTLKYYNFGQSIRKWVNIFQNGSESSIIQNGFMSESFGLKRGCRQGDPISPYLFVLSAEILGKMIRKNQHIQGININGNIFKLSQYADDTQVFLDGSELSLKETLNTLNQFYYMSGLKINIEKTRAIWIGSLSNSHMRLCQDCNLDWTQGTFKVLGVNFSSNVNEIWDLNYHEVLNKAENICKQWAKRKLTLIGRITVIKSLLLAKFTHLFLALPNPPGELIKQIEKMFYKFLWNNGPDRIKRSVIVKNIREGGLRMINISYFIKALKISWLRRVVQNSENNAWYALSNINFMSILTYGNGYAAQHRTIIDNPFWKDLLSSWISYCDTLKIENIKEVLASPIWYNSNLIHGRTFFINDWSNKGVRFISDLIDQNGNIYQFQAFKVIYGVRGTFLDYQALIAKIPNRWKTTINENKPYCIINAFNTPSSLYFQKVIKDKKGCRSFYDAMAGVSEINFINKWEQEVGNISQDDLLNYNLVIAELKEVALKDFQYKITNKILVTKSFLHRIRKIDENQCSYCSNQPETIIHLFTECEKVARFWQQLKFWLMLHMNLNLDTDSKPTIFSYQNKNELLSYISVLAKQYIYKNKFVNNDLNLDIFIQMLKKKFQNEKYIAFINSNMGKFFAKWRPMYNYFSN
ncbi:MAG: reverse transcriptase domain-containing protein, partial [Candidatus Thiodiazotropha endolucinida]|nr:hypothetical protein [Candidatus Thiodiazotropha taylori]MCW4273402.1 reverse transcriptase domain-containing protein [Candidatus Thiodiazotropha endolucinida]